LADIASIKYRAFLSYAHPDVAWARWLHTHLEGFHIDQDLVGRETGRGPVPESLRLFFATATSFPAATN
jgi:hypothetical protein